MEGEAAASAPLTADFDLASAQSRHQVGLRFFGQRQSSLTRRRRSGHPVTQPLELFRQVSSEDRLVLDQENLLKTTSPTEGPFGVDQEIL
jgi:hypothetical protein